jgi:hypothetical protein
MSAADISSPLYLAEILQMEGSVKPKIAADSGVFQAESVAVRRRCASDVLGSPSRPITGEFSVIKTT